MADLSRLPNLAALRAFEAAARHGNFSRAAEEIHVTHGAISHQVRALEEELGVQLFTRHGKRITITPDGLQFATRIRNSLMDIAIAAENLTADSRQKRLTLTTMPSFASRWLAPRLGRFIDRHPDVELILQSSLELVDLKRTPVDVAIRFGFGHYPGLVVEKLMDDFFYPVVSPKYRNGELPKIAQELKQCTLLRACQDEPWLPWFHAAEVDLPEPKGGLVIEDSALLVRSAIDGNGIALARHVLATQEVASGKLLRLFDVAIRCPHSYYFACTPQGFAKPQVQAFHEWLIEEVTEFKTQPGWPVVAEA
jgi:LysR family glycine cleavage system transcriptional activator